MEQFIESIFPSQKPPVDDKKSPVSAEEAARSKREADESKWETIYMVSAVVGTILVISAMMVSGIRIIGPVAANMVFLSWSLPGWQAHDSTLPSAKPKSS